MERCACPSLDRLRQFPMENAEKKPKAGARRNQGTYMDDPAEIM